jgi:hypothetical protein
MSYADSLLADGEVIVRRARQHWLSLFIDGWHGWLVLLLGLVALIAGLALRGGSGFSGTLGTLLSLVALVALVVGGAIVLLHVLRWRAQDYLVTNRRVLQVEGILNKRSGDSSLEKINDAVLDQSMVGRMFGYGDLDIMTAAEAAIDRFRMLPAPAAFKRDMLDQKYAYERDLAYRPGPPLRADPVPAAATAPVPGAATAQPPAPAPAPQAPVAVAAAPPAASPSRSDAQQVTETLARLADLRDRGAITAEEYEAKKGELLGRL